MIIFVKSVAILSNKVEIIEKEKDIINNIKPKLSTIMKSFRCDRCNQIFSSTKPICPNCGAHIKVENSFGGKSCESWIQEGMTFAQMNKFDAAISCLEEALKIDPNSEEAWDRLGLIYGRMKDYENAYKCMDRVSQINPGNKDAWMLKGTAAGTIGKFAEAIECFDRVLQFNPYDQNALKMQKIAESNLKTEKSLQDAINKNPNDLDNWLRKAVFYGQYQAFNKAIEYLDGALKIDPMNKKAISLKANAFAMLKRHEEALEMFNEALEKEPNSTDLLGSKGATLVMLNRLDEGIKIFERLLELDPNNDTAKKSLEMLKKQKGIRTTGYDNKLTDDLKREVAEKGAIEAMAQGVVKDFMGTEQGQELLEDAKEIMDKLPEVHKKTFRLITQVTNIPERNKLFDLFMKGVRNNDRLKVVAVYEGLIHYNPREDFVWSLFIQGTVYTNNIEKGFQTLSNAIQRDPNYHFTWEMLGVLYSTVENHKEAFNCFQRALSIKPDEYNVLRSIGQEYMELGDSENAIKFLQRYITYYPEDVDARNLLLNWQSGPKKVQKFCTKCGVPLQTNHKFCGECGAPTGR